jgi:hypothetical protein
MQSITTTGGDEQPRKYPYLGVLALSSGSLVVLFTARATGVVVSGPNLGDTSEFWGEINFVPFQGTVTLSND